MLWFRPTIRMVAQIYRQKTMAEFSANEKGADVMDYPIMKHL